MSAGSLYDTGSYLIAKRTREEQVAAALTVCRLAASRGEGASGAAVVLAALGLDEALRGVWSPRRPALAAVPAAPARTVVNGLCTVCGKPTAPSRPDECRRVKCVQERRSGA